MTGLLIFIGLILIVLNVLSIKKQNKSFNGALGNAIENVDGYDIRLGDIRREFSESILELQIEIRDIKETVEKSKRSNVNYDPEQDKRDERNYNFGEIKKEEPIDSYSEDVNSTEENEKTNDENKDEIIIEELGTNANNAKIEDIKRLFSEGLSADAISEMLHLGKGEVLLIKDLYIR